MTESETVEPFDAENLQSEDGCASWAPAIIAIGTLLLMVFFVLCGFAGWYIFQKRGEIAIRSLEGTVIFLEQAPLDPGDRAATIGELEKAIERGKSGELEEHQLAGIAQRLGRIPILHWGDIQSVDAMVLRSDSLSDVRKASIRQEISRLMRAIELDKVTVFDMPHVFEPVSSESDNEVGYQLTTNLDDAALQEFSSRAGMVADRAEVPKKTYDVKLQKIVARLIDAGAQSGMR